MTTRPLEQIRRETKTANRAPHLRRKNKAAPDPIDALDDIGIGGAYHHDGPYDATLASRNRDKRYAPVEAVRRTNMLALAATPREYIRDSLLHHVPLQGTASVPSGQTDMFGRRMSYEEGADLMREPDAPGGPYRRWEHVPYHPDDLKGKGEPSYTIERDAREQKMRRRRAGLPDDGDRAGSNVYEMRSTAGGHGASGRRRHGPGPKDGYVAVRQRSHSESGAAGWRRQAPAPAAESRDADVRRSGANTKSSKRLSDGLKRRIGSIKRKLQDDDA